MIEGSARYFVPRPEVRPLPRKRERKGERNQSFFKTLWSTPATKKTLTTTTTTTTPTPTTTIRKATKTTKTTKIIRTSFPTSTAILFHNDPTLSRTTTPPRSILLPVSENNSDFFQTRKCDQLTCVRPTLRVVARKLDGHGAGVWRGSGGPPPPPPRLPPTEPFDNSRRFLKMIFFHLQNSLTCLWQPANSTSPIPKIKVSSDRKANVRTPPRPRRHSSFSILP